MRADLERPAPAIAVFASLNFVLAGLCFLGFAAMIAVLVYGIVYSGDQGSDLVAGVIGCSFLASLGLIGFGVYLTAGIGLVRHRTWGYYFHCAGAVLAVFSCIGIVYTVLALVFALQPDFSAAFFPPADRLLPRGKREPRSWEEF
jgi:hypothetical protein